MNAFILIPAHLILMCTMTDCTKKASRTQGDSAFNKRQKKRGVENGAGPLVVSAPAEGGKKVQARQTLNEQLVQKSGESEEFIDKEENAAPYEPIDQFKNKLNRL